LAKADPANAEWQRDLSVCLTKVGDVLVDQGNLIEGLQAYRASLTIAERLAKADPGNAAWQHDLSASYERAGNVLKAQGHLPEALQAYRDSLTIAERLAKADPSNADWQRGLQISIGKIGGLAYKFVLAGKFTTALEAADQAIALAPEKTWLYTNRAHALMFLHRVDKARAIYLNYRGAMKVVGDKSWEVIILEDFAELRKAGLSHPLMDEIESKLTESE
jgi:tetratricopeptide (TPR) repeat protein